MAFSIWHFQDTLIYYTYIYIYIYSTIDISYIYIYTYIYNVIYYEYHPRRRGGAAAPAARSGRAGLNNKQTCIINTHT